ncbi:hypothetical protein WME94_52100 [Sorangium sp. So ce429]
MSNENEGVDAGDERRKAIFWLVTALGLVIAFKGVVVILDLAAVLK